MKGIGTELPWFLDGCPSAKWIESHGSLCEHIHLFDQSLPQGQSTLARRVENTRSRDYVKAFRSASILYICHSAWRSGMIQRGFHLVTIRSDPIVHDTSGGDSNLLHPRPVSYPEKLSPLTKCRFSEKPYNKIIHPLLIRKAGLTLWSVVIIRSPRAEGQDPLPFGKVIRT